MRSRRTSCSTPPTRSRSSITGPCSRATRSSCRATHVVTLTDLPAPGVGPFFIEVQRVARAVVDGLDADGSFVAMNNVVSQSVAAPPRPRRAPPAQGRPPGLLLAPGEVRRRRRSRRLRRPHRRRAHPCLNEGGEVPPVGETGPRPPLVQVGTGPGAHRRGSEPLRGSRFLHARSIQREDDRPPEFERLLDVNAWAGC